jgi:hypothetical protein
MISYCFKVPQHGCICMLVIVCAIARKVAPGGSLDVDVSVSTI